MGSIVDYQWEDLFSFEPLFKIHQMETVKVLTLSGTEHHIYPCLWS